QMTRDRGAQGVLRSALWGQRKDHGTEPWERLVTWSTWRKEHSFFFAGGIIMVANRPLDDWPELEAVKTRIACMQLHASDHELAALMRTISLSGSERDGH